MNIGRKGDANWFLVSLIIILFSLAVIVLILVKFNFKPEVDRAACKESAVIRASLPDKLDAQDLVSLTCKTNRICVTDKTIGNGNCDDGLGSKFVTTRLSGSRENKETQIKMLLAREMADCWNMLGEGNLKIFSSEISTNAWNGKIVVCSRVMFDDTVIGSKAVDQITEVTGMNNYLLSHKVPGKDVSYWDYLRNANDGDTLQMLNGNAVVGSQINDRMDLTNQKAIFYLESSTSKIGGVMGSVTAVVTSTLIMGAFGGAGFKGAGILGRAVGSVAGAGQLAVLGAAGSWGWELGDKFYTELKAPGLDPEVGAVSGVFLTDYTVEGFSVFESKDKKIGFENIP